MLCESEKRGKGTGLRRGAEDSREKNEAGEGCSPSPASFQKLPLASSIAQTLEELVCTDDLSMESAGDERFAFNFAGLAIGDSDVVYLKSAADRALVSGLCLFEVGKRADFIALREGEVTLCLDDGVYGGSAELILLLFSVKCLLLKLAGLHSGGDLSSALRECDVGVADIEERSVSQLPFRRLQLSLGQNGARVFRLGRAVAQRKCQSQLAGIFRKDVVKDLALRVAKALLHGAGDGGRGGTYENGASIVENRSAG